MFPYIPPRIAFKLAIKYLVGFNKAPFLKHKDAFENKTGLEIGGPSGIFGRNKFLPVYKYAERVDGVNFSNATVWEGKIEAGSTYKYTADRIGVQYVCEGNDLREIADNTYDFVLSSHNLEHFANPLKAVAEWKRVVKPGGVILLVLPDKRYTFDNKRNVTRFEHLLEDFTKNIGEDDLTHLEEILSLHDRQLDPPARDKEYFKQRCLKNFENRCLHQHVFDHALLKRIFEHFQIQPLYEAEAPFYHVIALGRVGAK